MSATRVHAILLAAGRGARLGGNLPKQFQAIRGRPLLHYALETFLNHGRIYGVQVVLPEAFMDFPLPINDKLLPPIRGGSERHLSAANAILSLTANENDFVLIHDAARVLMPPLLIDRICLSLRHHDAVTPTISLQDSLINGESLMAVDRANYRLVQTPQGFRFGVLRDAMRAFLGEKNGQTRLPTSEFEIVRCLRPAARFAMVEGSPENFKVTTPSDWARLNYMLP